MAIFKQIASASIYAASNCTYTSNFFVPGEFQQFLLRIPPAANWCSTNTCAVTIEAYTLSAPTSAFYPIGYSNNPATTTSAWFVWSTAGSAAVSGALVICEALAFVPSVANYSGSGDGAGGWARLKFSNTATAATDFAIYGRKFD